VIYLDTSVALAHLLAEDRRPPDALWQGTIVSSRLLEYEVWTRIHARKLGRSHGEIAEALLGRIAFLEVIPEVVNRAREAFPVDVRTLDALHLASVHFLREQGQDVALASYDQRMLAAARKSAITMYPLD
jgi:hypothetical protein